MKRWFSTLNDKVHVDWLTKCVVWWIELKINKVCEIIFERLVRFYWSICTINGGSFLKICTKCKKENEDSNDFCGGCGQKINVEVKKSTGCLVFILIFIVLFAISLKACGDSPEVAAKKAADLQLAKEKVKVTFEVQDIHEYKQKIVIFIKNESDKTFSGSVDIKISNSINEVLQTDYIYPEKVAPGNQTYVIYFLPICDGYKLYSNIYKANFEWYRTYFALTPDNLQSMSFF